MIFGTLVVGIAGHGDDVRRIGRLAWRSFLYFELPQRLHYSLGLSRTSGAAWVELHSPGSVNEAKESPPNPHK